MRKTILFILFAACLSCAALAEDDPKVTCSIQEKWGNLFGGSEASFHLVVNSSENMSGKLTWALAVNGRVVRRGEQNANLLVSQPVTTEMSFDVPKVKDGVIQELTLSGSFSYGEGKTAGFRKSLWVFPEDPFYQKSEWLKGLNIILFDPKEKTEKLLTEEEVPFSLVRNVEALAQQKGLLLIGEGVSFKDYRGLGPAIIEYVEKGGSVLCLAPSSGEFSLPGMGEELEGVIMPAGLFMHDNEIIKKMDKHLDSVAWAPDGKVNAAAINIVGERGPVSAVFSEEGKGWSYLEARYVTGRGKKQKSKMVVSTFGVISKWDESPTPRFLFVKLLERVDRNKEKE